MTTDQKPTCGPLYKRALEHFCGSNQDDRRAFAIGFMMGQAEKVYLGVCPAAMFRPSADKKVAMLMRLQDICGMYGLSIFELPVKTGSELWIYQLSRTRQAIEGLQAFGENSESWHEMRAFLCGIPADRIDFRFHERPGYGEDCD